MNQSVFQDLSACEHFSNLNLVLLDENADRQHPMVELAQSKGVSFPAYFLLSPNNEILVLQEGKVLGVNELVDLVNHQILSSSLRDKFLANVQASFARVLLIDSNDEEKNREAFDLIKDNCRQIKDLMPLMPKEIRTPPQILHLSRERFESEKVFLWSLGLDSVVNEPRAVVLYGRGRMMGQPLPFQKILEGGTYKYMTLIGADCECGIDRKWMLGRQALLKWDTDSQQALTTELGFDVDSPSILAEMSRIIAKETEEGNINTLSYGPENINVDLAFGLQDEVDEMVDDSSLFYWVLFGSIVVLFFIVSVMSFWYWKRGKN